MEAQSAACLKPAAQASGFSPKIGNVIDWTAAVAIFDQKVGSDCLTVAVSVREIDDA